MKIVLKGLLIENGFKEWRFLLILDDKIKTLQSVIVFDILVWESLFRCNNYIEIDCKWHCTVCDNLRDRFLKPKNDFKTILRNVNFYSF